MGIYVNPGNQGFQEILHSEYVDKTGLISLINSTVGTTQKLTCVSRPRRFGKSFAAKMLCAYYDCSCASHNLFDPFEIAKSNDYLSFLNKFLVIYIDISGFTSSMRMEHKPLVGLASTIQKSIHDDLLSSFSYLDSHSTLSSCLLKCVQNEGKKFVFIIDEWDAPIRESDDRVLQSSYLDLLRSWFKNNNFTPQVVAAAYMTGILPIKKDGSQSAISDFIEYPILFPDDFARFTGFTESDVASLCDKHHMDFNGVKAWYDGYHFSGDESIYNPYSVMQAIRSGKLRSYWQRTSAAESLMTYINLDYSGLQEIIARLTAGEQVEIDVDRFENDFVSFKSKDDVLTLLAHLGYLAYSEEDKTVRIPNREVRIEFEKMLNASEGNTKWIELLSRSRKLLADTITGNEQAVASALETIRHTEYAPTFYNNEQALRYVIKFAYIAGIDQYINIEELPSGHGIADVVYIPKRYSALPALVVELKWNKASSGAIAQIKDKNYPQAIKDFGSDILLVGISYDKKTDRHECKIEKV